MSAKNHISTPVKMNMKFLKDLSNLITFIWAIKVSEFLQGMFRI